MRFFPPDRYVQLDRLEKDGGDASLIEKLEAEHERMSKAYAEHIHRLSDCLPEPLIRFALQAEMCFFTMKSFSFSADTSLPASLYSALTNVLTNPDDQCILMVGDWHKQPLALLYGGVRGFTVSQGRGGGYPFLDPSRWGKWNYDEFDVPETSGLQHEIWFDTGTEVSISCSELVWCLNDQIWALPACDYSELDAIQW